MKPRAAQGSSYEQRRRGRIVSNWFASTRYAAIDSADAQTKGPAAILDFRQNRFAITQVSAASIAAATPADLAKLQPAALSDIATITRSGVATRVDASGNVVDVPADTPRFDYSNNPTGELLLEGPSRNEVRNNAAQGAVVGTPGTFPTNWMLVNGLGLTRSIVGFGTDKGIDYVDIRFQGVMGDGNGINLRFDANQQVAAIAGDLWNSSAYIAIVGGSIANVNGMRMQTIERDSGGLYVNGTTSLDFKGNLDATLRRFNVTRTFSGAGFAQAEVQITASNGVALDITLRIGLPQLEKSQFATSVIRTTGAAVSRNADSFAFGPKMLAIMQRSAVGAVVQAFGIWGSLGNFIGGTTSRVVGLSSNQAQINLGNVTVVQLAGSVVTPLPSFGVSAAWDATGKIGSYNTNAFSSDAVALDATLTNAFLGRGSNFANGWYDQLVLYPFRPTSAELVRLSKNYDNSLVML